MPTWTPGERVGSYRIEQSLKSGGMGTLVVARKEGANVYYSVTDRTIFNLLDVAREIFNNHLAGVQNILEEIRLDQPKRTARR